MAKPEHKDVPKQATAQGLPIATSGVPQLAQEPGAQTMELSTALGEWFKQAKAHQQAGALQEAEVLYRRILSFVPDHVEALSRLGTIRLMLGHREDCVILLGISLRFNPAQADALNNRGIALRGLGRHQEALASYNGAIVLKPDYAEAYNNRGNVLFDLKKFQDALTSYEHALKLRPEYADAFNGQGRALACLKRHAEAIASFDAAIAINPKYADAYDNRGAVLHELSQHEAAIASFDQAAEVNANHYGADLRRGLIRLLCGNYLEGWAYYDRWRSRQKRGRNQGFESTLWRGEQPIADKTVLIWGEQGLGDEIQFSRYVGQVSDMGAHIVLEVAPPLKALLSSLPVAGNFSVIARGEAVPHFDLHASVVSLPMLLGAELESIPLSRRYLFADQKKSAQWARRMEKQPKTTLRVGIAWAGSPKLPMDKQRSIPLALLAPLFEITGVSFYSLQKGDTSVAELHASPWKHLMVDWTEDLQDFADTAALVDNLDLVICVDTSVVHLAGALGTPVWLLNRFNTCWRWLLDREDSPWYASVKVFRQPSLGDWTGAVQLLVQALQQRVRGDLPSTGI